MRRKLLNEFREYTVEYNGTRYRFKKAWHYLDSGEPYHYIHVYKGGLIAGLPYKRFAWVVNHDGTITDLTNKKRSI